MLPRQVSQLPHLDIAAYIKLATEVGGAGERFVARRMASFGQTGGKMKKRLEFKLSTARG